MRRIDFVANLTIQDRIEIKFPFLADGEILKILVVLLSKTNLTLKFGTSELI